MVVKATPVVIDASIGIGIVRKERGWKDALHSLRLRRAAGSPFLAPSLFWLEIVNVLSRRYRLAPASVLEAIVELEAMGIESVELDRPSLLLALDMVARHSLSAYDAAYLSLADSAHAHLMTADSRLAAAAGRRALLIDGDRSIREQPVTHDRGSDFHDEWASWPGAAAYLRELRARIRPPSTSEPVP